MQIKSGQIAAFEATPSVRRVLVYGPDQGQARLLSDRLLAKFAPQRVVFDGESLAGRSGDLAEAMAGQATLFGPAQAVRVRNAADRCTKTLKDILAQPNAAAALVVEAGELAASSSLRKLFEGAANSAAIACYPPEGARRRGWITQELAQGGAKADAEALALLDLWLPGDSMLATAELAKLALFAGPGGVAGADAVRSLLMDAGEADLDDAVMAAVGGDPTGALRALRRQPGYAAVGLLRALQRHLQRLLAARAQVDAGANAEDAMRQLRPPVFFKESDRFRAHLASWTTARLERALGRAFEGEQTAKRSGWPDDALCGQLLLELAAGERDSRRGARA